MNHLHAIPLLLLSWPTSALDIQPSRNPDTGLLTWTNTDRGFHLELQQLPPDYIRAVYEAQGFPAALIEGIAEYCVFGTVASNISGKRLSYQVADWRYVSIDGTPHPVKTKSQWLSEWQTRGIGNNWTLLPDRQHFDAGDWYQGFTTIKTHRDHPFELIYSWTLEEETHVGHIKEMRCAPENTTSDPVPKTTADHADFTVVYPGHSSGTGASTNEPQPH